MNLAQLAKQDNAMLIEDSVTGFGHDIVLTFQDASTISLVGDFDRTSMSTDPMTGVKFVQAKASITVVSSRLTKAIDDTVGVTVSLGGSVVYTGVVMQALPDDTQGWTTIMLERVGA